MVQNQAGEIYDLSWGQYDDLDDDLVAPYKVWGNPLCIKKGTQLGVKLVWEPGDTPMPWVVQDSQSQSVQTISPYWTNDDCLPSHHGWHSATSTHWFPTTLPSYVDYVHITGMILIQTPDGPGGLEGEALDDNLENLDSEVFIVLGVLGTPPSQMNPPWVNVLQKSCDWAFEADTAAVATRKLTEKFWEKGTYNGGTGGHAWGSGENETFNARAFIESGLVGQCNDFADFLVCASWSIGALPLMPQRSYPFSSVFDEDTGDGWTLTTNTIIAAHGQSGQQAVTWTFHQFAVYADPKVYDASCKLPNDFFVDMQRDSTYQTALVDFFTRYVDFEPVKTYYSPHSPPWNPPTVNLTLTTGQ